MEMTPEEAVRKFAALKQQQKDIENQIEELVPVIAGAAEFKLGSKTGHLVAAGIKMTVTKRENEKWNQAELAKVKAWTGDEKFFKFFKAEYKPQSAAHTKAMAEDEQMALVIAKCRTVTPGSTGLSWEPLEEKSA